MGKKEELESILANVLKKNGLGIHRYKDSDEDMIMGYVDEIGYEGDKGVEIQFLITDQDIHFSVGEILKNISGYTDEVIVEMGFDILQVIQNINTRNSYGRLVFDMEEGELAYYLAIPQIFANQDTVEWAVFITLRTHEFIEATFRLLLEER